MGLYGSAPEAPDPQKTASAQTATNIGTAVANNVMGNVNQVTPDGNLTYTYTTQKWTDPTSGKVYDLQVPTATQSLSQQQQAIKNQTDAAELNMATLANNQSGKLNDLLGKPINISGAPAGGNAGAIGLPQYQQFGSGPKLQTSLGNYGNVQSSIAGAGNIQKQVADSGKIQNQLGNAGDITRSYETDFSADRQKVEDALMQRLNPQMERDRAALETRLTNQGLQPGSEAYNRAIDEANRSSTDARLGAILSAGQEQSRLAGLANQSATFQNSAQQQAYNQLLGSGQFANSAQAQQYAQNANNMQMGNSAQQQQFGQNQAQLQANNAAQQQKFGQGLAGAQFGNDALQQQYQNQNTATAGNNALQDQSFNSQQSKFNMQNQQRAQYLNELYAQRNQPINEIIGLMSGAQVNSPSFVPTQSNPMPTVDYAGLVQQDYANKMGAYNQQQGMMQGLLGGALGFGGQLASLSDKNAKKDIKKVGGLYEYRYKGEGKNAPKRIGVMAQEVEKIRPDAVSRRPDGLRQVNYGALFNAGKRE
ncbi:tail fiber domain-containing protein [Sinorhizobium meliloti]|uniref:tail fiber domain-containing protein n=1 Tax=Rhizobium meliloti TaxID=382 RepID=UPI000FD79342|nr:tail fiber domain-containing protein [Sinorhizobium meliloti]MDX0281745.1 tail fiber domain-containing protein [Sinorhizobium meliloti]MQV27849.1 tail fiber domain-containing protein [Sinorhizobium meliloti]RVK78227.1 tail fiber domain-containing protein [Sinorhizobium meliloti]RVL27520.1 tail fiber domain-containing protein [Sinorhizobium meliloti]